MSNRKDFPTFEFERLAENTSDTERYPTRNRLCGFISLHSLKLLHTC